MTNTYRALTDAAKAAYDDDVFERDFDASEEQDVLNSGLLELVPRRYKVLSINYSAAAQGETFEAAYTVENEAALIQGGHIERVDDKPEPPDNRPAQNDLKEVWVDYAITQGIERDEAEEMTKTELVELLAESAE